MAEEARHRGLGRGLSALLDEEPQVHEKNETSRPARTVPVAYLKPNRFQPRRTFKDDELRELANSIREKGILVLACGTIPVPTVLPTSSPMALLA